MLTNIERQARYIARRAEQTGAAIRYRRPTDRRTRPGRWHDAVAELLALQVEYAAWADALPDGLCDTALAEALQAIVNLDLSELADIELPRGYGRDDRRPSEKITPPDLGRIQPPLTAVHRSRIRAGLCIAHNV